jgi:hypothetical protein
MVNASPGHLDAGRIFFDSGIAMASGFAAAA